MRNASWTWIVLCWACQVSIEQMFQDSWLVHRGNNGVLFVQCPT